MFNTLIVLIPTLIFIFMILWGFLFGLIRGFRKSLILWIQAGVAAAIALTFYLIIVNASNTDSNTVSIVNNYMGANGLQNALGVPASCDTLTSIISETIIKSTQSTNYGEGIKLVINENTAYLAAVVSYVYHIIFAIVAYLVFWVIRLLLYIIYLIFYPERRHKKKIEKSDDVNKKYNKHMWFGSLLGSFRGLVAALVFISFIGAGFFVVAGNGEKTYEETTLGDPNSGYSKAYSYYTGIEGYGTNGIFKILNTFRNDKNVPYYLAISSIVYQGQINGEQTKVGSNSVYFTEEFGLYSSFISDVFDLMVETDKPKFEQYLANPDNTDLLLDILSNETFREKFDKRLNEFEGTPYFDNFGLSIINSVLANIDKFVEDENSKDVLCILFKEGYKSPNISGDQTNAPALTLENVIKKKDVKYLLNIVMTIVLEQKSGQEMGIDTLVKIVPEIKNLSIINATGDEKTKINTVLERLFVAVVNGYVDKNTELNSFTIDEKDLKQIEAETVSSTPSDWIGEIQSLLDAFVSFGNLAKDLDILNQMSEPVELIKSLFAVYDETNSNYAKNKENFESVITALKNSVVVKRLMYLKVVSSSIEGIAKGIYEDIYIPTIDYSNEINNFLDVIVSILKNQANKTMIEDLLKLSDSSNVKLDDVAGLLGNVETLLQPGKEDGVLHQILSSKILKTIVSAALLKVANSTSSELTLIIPNSALDKVDGKVVNSVNMDAIEEIFVMLTKIEISEDSTVMIRSIIKTIDSLLECDTLTVTIVNLLVNTDQLSDTIVIPTHLKTKATRQALQEYDASTSPWKNETRDILLAFDALFNVATDTAFSFETADFEAIIKTTFTSLRDKYSNTDYTKLQMVYNSEVLWATLSKYLNQFLGSMVDSNVASACQATYTGCSDEYYSFTEFATIVDVIFDLGIEIANLSTTSDFSKYISNLSGASKVDPAKSKLQVAYDSYLFKGLIAKAFDSVVGDGKVLSSTPLALETTPFTYYKITEVEAFCSILTDLAIASIEAITLSEITLNNNIIAQICKSNILRKTVTDSVDNLELVYPAIEKMKDGALYYSTTYDSTYSIIDANALNELLVAISTGYGITDLSNMSGMDIKLPEEDKQGALLESSIILATISSLVEYTDGSGNKVVPMIDSDLLSKTEDAKNGGSINVIAKEEITAFINAQRVISSGNDDFNFTFDIATLATFSEADVEVITKSSIASIIISNMIYASDAPITITLTKMGDYARSLDASMQPEYTVVKVDGTGKQANYKVLNADGFNAVINQIKSLGA